MKKIFFVSRYLILAGFLVFYSCKKNDQIAQNNSDSLMASKTTSWLEQQKSKFNQNGARKVQALMDNLELSQIQMENSRDGEKFIVVPIKKSLVLNNNKGKNPENVLLLVLDKNNNIRKGNIVQYIAKDGLSRELAINAFSDIYNFRVVKDGKYRFLTVNDSYSFEWEYKDGRIASESEMKKGQPTEAQRTCIAWYLVTTTFFTDGTTEVDTEFLGYTCDDGCGTWTINGGGTFCEDGGGGSGNPDIVEVDINGREIEWEVGRNPNNLWVLTSTELFKGNTSTSKFTSTSHSRSGVFPTGVVTWTETQVNVTGSGTSTAHSDIHGWVQSSGGAVNTAGNSKSFTFRQVFN